MTDNDSDVRSWLRPDLRASFPAYEPIEPPEVLAARLGIPPERIVKLDGNENPYGMGDRAIAALREVPSDFALYPDPEQRALRAALALRMGVGAEQIVAGAGSDELIDLLIRLLVAPGEAVVVCPPTFGMYRFSTLVQGGRLVEAPRKADFGLDIDATVAAIRSSGANLVFIASPNNPTGNMLSTEELDALLATGTFVVVDEAYMEFTGEGGTVCRVASGAPNLAVLRTFSKWAGLAGLRVGYGVFPRPIAEALMVVKPPYTPNTAATFAALASLEDLPSLMGRVEAIVWERDRLAKALGALPGVRPFPSRANFVLARFTHRPAREVRDALRQRGIFVRHFDQPPVDDCLRITAGRPEQTDAVIAALTEALHG